MNAASVKDINTPLIEQSKQKKFLAALWCIYLGVLSFAWISGRNLASPVETERQLVLLILLLYATHYFSCRAKGNNFLFQLWGIKPYSKGWLRVSDLLAIVTYISCSGILIFQILTK